MANGLLLAALRIGRAADDEFHDWYDTEHLPERARVPGVLRASRWIEVSDPRLAVATYELADVDVLRGPAWQAINGQNLSPWSTRLLARVEWVMRAEAEQILPGKELPAEDADGLLLNAMTVAPEHEAESKAWDVARTSDWTTRVTPHFRDRIRLVLRRYVRGRAAAR
jgi:hypothetical protein